MTDAVQWAGWVWRGVLVWDKTEAAKGPNLGYFGYQAEFVVWATNGPVANKPSLADGGEGRMPGVFRKAVVASEKLHQVGKPVEVMRWLVRCCPKGGRILDPFCGSATTLVAARAEGRHSVGVECSPAYAAIARERLARDGKGGPFAPGAPAGSPDA